MHIVCNSHSLFDAQYVQNLSDCSIPVSLLPNNNSDFIITFSGTNFLNLLNSSLGNFDKANKLKLRKSLSEKIRYIQNHVSSSDFLKFNNESDYFSDITDGIIDICIPEGVRWNLATEENFKTALLNHDLFYKLISFLSTFKERSLKSYNKNLAYKKQYILDNNVKYYDFIFGKDYISINELVLFSGQSYFDLLEKVKDYIESKSDYFLVGKNYDKIINLEFEINELYKCLDKTDFSSLKMQDLESFNIIKDLYKKILELFKFYYE